jgi:hypothetical protein
MAPEAIEPMIATNGEPFDMNGRTIAGFLLALLLVGGAAAIGITAYNAGVTQGLVESGQVVVAPGQAVGPYVGGYAGWGPGFGFFGFLGVLLFIFLVFGLIRAAFGGGRGRGGWGPGWGGPNGRHGRGAWDERVREIHDELHRSGGPADKDTADQPRS